MASRTFGLSLFGLRHRSQTLGPRECPLQRGHRQKRRRPRDLGKDSKDQQQAHVTRTADCRR